VKGPKEFTLEGASQRCHSTGILVDLIDSPPKRGQSIRAANPAQAIGGDRDAPDTKSGKKETPRLATQDVSDTPTASDKMTGAIEDEE